MNKQQRGMMVVISGPSGAGKGTLASLLLREDPSFSFSVSVTTRAMRSNETPDVDYHFVQEEEFDRLLKAGAFLEHAQVHGHRYGTLKSEVEERLASGQNVLLDIDVQGAAQVMEKMQDCVTVFVLPPSFRTLRARLTGRRTDSEADIERRLLNARQEILELPRYRYAIVNDVLETAFQNLMAVITAEKHNTARFCPAVEE